MDYVKLATENFLEATTRGEYLKYAEGNSYVEVDKEHFLDVAKVVKQLWEAKFNTPYPTALVIAGLYHDFDRVFPEEYSNDGSIRTDRRIVDTKSIHDDTYTGDEVKKILHPRNCALIFKDYNHSLPQLLQEDVSYLIGRHEIGAEISDDGSFVEKIDKFSNSYNLSEAADVLCEADAISFFNILIYSYVKGRSDERIKQKIRFSYSKLSDEGKQIIKDAQYKAIDHDGKTIDVETLVRSTIGS